MTRNWIAALTGLGVGLALAALPAGAEDKPDCSHAQAPRMVEGQVVKVDANAGKLSVRLPDGTMHEFDGSKETLQDHKAGDTIKAKLRLDPRCDNK